MEGFISSIQSMGTVDGPGVRFVVFLQGCPLRCGYCHNPETRNFGEGTKYSADEIVNKALRFKEYFGKDGGITLSGGEPIMQPEFAAEIFKKCRKNGISTCLDTSGCVINDAVEELIDLTDYVMLDIKFTSDSDYLKHIGCSIGKPLEFLKLLNRKNKTVRLRQVIVPSLNDNDESLKTLAEIAKNYPCVKGVELLPFKKICKTKYENLSLDFPFDCYNAAGDISNLQQKLNEMIKTT